MLAACHLYYLFIFFFIFFYLFVYLFIHLFTYLYIYLLIYLFIYLFIYFAAAVASEIFKIRSSTIKSQRTRVNDGPTMYDLMKFKGTYRTSFNSTHDML